MKDSLAFMGTRGYSCSDFVFVMNSDGVLLHLSPPCTSHCTQKHSKGAMAQICLANEQSYMGKSEMPEER